MDFKQGDIYAYQLPNGYYSVMKVLEYNPKKKKEGILFILTSYFDDILPNLDDERIDLPYEKDYRAVAEEIDVDDLIFVGNKQLNEQELALVIKGRRTMGGGSLFYFLIEPYRDWLTIHNPEEKERFFKELRDKEFEENKKIISPLPSKAFWEIISLIDLEADDPLEKARDKLAFTTEKQIKQFEEALAQTLYKLDTEKHARSIGEAAYVDEETFFFARFLSLCALSRCRKGQRFL